MLVADATLRARGTSASVYVTARILTFIASSTSRYGPQEDRPFKAMRRLWEKKNFLDFFHVCPLLLHEMMGNGGDRPVHKFVFACPGRAAAMVSAR